MACKLLAEDRRLTIRTWCWSWERWRNSTGSLPPGHDIGMKATANCHWFVNLLTAAKAVLQRSGDVLLDSNRAAPNYKINVKT